MFRFISHLARYVWTFPTTLLGLFFIPPTLLTRGRCSVVDGVVELHGGLVTWVLKWCIPLRGGASALTLGHVVLGRDTETLDRTRRHERVHVRQAERWGPFFIPIYLLACLWAWVRGGHPYWDNPFEREAYAEG